MNNLRLFAIALLVFGVLSFAPAQSTDYGKKSDEVLNKLRQLDLLNQILPVVMTKEQIRKILPAVEKAREIVKVTEKAEADQLKKLEAKIDPALKEAYEMGKVPSDEVLKDYAKTFAKLQIVRKSVVEANTRAVIEKLKEVLNKGQIAAARNALTPHLFDPTIDPTKLDDDGKLAFWTKLILLDPLAYPILLKLSK